MSIWPMTSLDEVLVPVSQPEFVRSDITYQILGAHWYAEGLYIKEIKPGSGIQAAKVYRVEEGDFVYNRLLAWKGSFAIATRENHNCYVSNEFPCFKVKRDCADGQYLWKYFSRSSVWEDALGLSTGGTPTSRNRLKEEKLLAMKIPLPPLQEQRRIVARIEALADRIEEARDVRHQSKIEADLLVNSKLDTLFAQGAKDGWLVGQLGDYVIDACYGTSERTTDDSSGIPVLRMGNIQGGHLDLRHLKYPRLSEKDKNKLLLKLGDVLVNRTNSAELVGKCAVLNEPDDYSFASYLIRLRLDIKRAHPRLIAAYVNSPAGRSYMFAERRQMTGQANVNATKLKALPIALPVLDQQRNIVDYLDSLQAKVNTLKKLQGETTDELAVLLPSILDKAFKGKL